MTKAQFISELKHSLSDMPENDIQSSLDYYSEMIDDRIEAGMGEDEAISALGNPRAVAREIKLELPFSALVKSKCKEKLTFSRLGIILLIVSSPIWLPLCGAVLAVGVAVYAVLWAAFAAMWAFDFALFAALIGGICAFVQLVSSNTLSALLYLGIGILSAGASSIMTVFGIKLSGMFVKLHISITKYIKGLIIGKENNQ